MSGDSPEMKDFFDRLKAETKLEERSDITNTAVAVAIGAALAYWAYGTFARACLFGYLVFAAAAVATGSSRRCARSAPATKPEGC